MPASSAPEDSSLVERILAIAAAVAVGVALLGFAMTLAQLGLRESWPWLREGIWPLLFAVPAILLPIGLLCVILLLAISAIRKGRGRG